jgi:hypothetical protein
MSRWIGFFICLILGLVMLALGLLVPAHLRGVDLGVLHQAGRTTPSVIEKAQAFVSERKLGPAQMLLEAARQAKLPGIQDLGLSVGNLAMSHPELVLLGAPDPRLETIVQGSSSSTITPITDLVVQREPRENLLRVLNASPRPAVQRLLDCRSLTNTVLFTPAYTSSGQALDTALIVCGLLMDGGYLTKEISDQLASLTAAALAGQSSQRLEQALLDFMSLGQRMNWGQLSTFVGDMREIETLRLTANLARGAGQQLPILFTTVVVSGQPAETARFLMTFSQTSYNDLSAALGSAVGGVKEILHRQQPVYRSQWTGTLEFGPFKRFAAWGRELDFRLHLPAIGLKWFFYFCSGFLFAATIHYFRTQVSELERPLQVGGVHFVRESLFGLGFVLAVLLVTEPFLAQDSQRIEFPFHFRLPGVASVAAVAAAKSTPSKLMNQLSLLTLLLFFVLQALIYTACIIKLAEIKRQNVPARIKLKLLDNEDHLFDAGLYLGFAGTIISLILVSLGVIRPSLMAAYSSTSFGILFVSVFKIFNLRPVRRRLLLESEIAGSSQLVQAAAHA